MSIFVFVSVKLNSECGNSPLTFSGGETLLANGSSLVLSIATGDSLASRSICLRPQGPLLPTGEMEQQLTPGPLPTSAWMWGWWRWPSLGLRPRSLCMCGSWPSSHPLGKPNSLTLCSPSLIGLISSETPTSLCGFFFVFVLFFLILHNHSLNLNL